MYVHGIDSGEGEKSQLREHLPDTGSLSSVISCGAVLPQLNAESIGSHFASPAWTQCSTCHFFLPRFSSKLDVRGFPE